MIQKSRLKPEIKDQLLKSEVLIATLAEQMGYSNGITVKNYIKQDLEKLTLPVFEMKIKDILGISQEIIIHEIYNVENTNHLHE